MNVFLGVIFALLAFGALAIIALFGRCDREAKREQEERIKRR